EYIKPILRAPRSPPGSPFQGATEIPPSPVVAPSWHPENPGGTLKIPVTPWHPDSTSSTTPLWHGRQTGHTADTAAGQTNCQKLVAHPWHPRTHPDPSPAAISLTDRALVPYNHRARSVSSRRTATCVTPIAPWSSAAPVPSGEWSVPRWPRWEAAS